MSDIKPENSMEDSLDPNSLGELMLKNAALTISAKGISDDLKEVIKIKTNFIKEILKDTIKLTESFLSCKDKKTINSALSREGVLRSMLEHTLTEVFVTNTTLNNILTSFILKEQNIREEQKDTIMKNIESMIDLEIKKFQN